MNPTRVVLTVWLLTAPAPSRGTTPGALAKELRATAETLRDKALAGTPALATVKSLTYEAGPRSAGSRGDKAAVAWGLRAMREAGLDNVHAESTHSCNDVAGDTREPIKIFTKNT